jgi:hypothetical protein
MRFLQLVQERLGVVPASIAVMGKWEPFLPAERCLEEVGARAAAALALAEALELELEEGSSGPASAIAPYYLSAEARLRGQDRPGCVMAAEILARLGADPGRIRCCPGANRTWNELQVLDRMRGKLGVDNLLLLTARYHVARTRSLLRELQPRLSGAPLVVCAVEDELIQEALTRLPPSRRQQLEQAIQRGRRGGSTLSPTLINELVARLGRRFPRLQGLVADVVRGRPASTFPPMFRPDI